MYFTIVFFLGGGVERWRGVNLQKIVDLISIKHETKPRGLVLASMRHGTGCPPKTLKFVNSVFKERVERAEREGRRRTRPPGSQSAGSL